MIRRRTALWIVLLALLAVCPAFAPAVGAKHDAPSSALPAPIAIYSYLPASSGSFAGTPIDESFAMRQFTEMRRLRKAGVRFDYDLIDASWFEPGGSGLGRAPDWPHGPHSIDFWIAKCRAAGVRPGLRFTGNTLATIARPPASPSTPASPPNQGTNSLSQNDRAPALFDDEYLPTLISALQSWYGRGVRLFEFDSIDLTAATSAPAAGLRKDPIVARNVAALRDALVAFRGDNRDAVLLVVTGPETAPDPPTPPDHDPPNFPSNPPPGRNGLGGFQLLSTGPPKPSVAPQADLWRSMDIDSDTRVRLAEQSGVPLQHIESVGFTAGGSASSPHAPQHEWRAAFLLSMARGGWVNTLRGNLQLIQGDDARWMARAQRLFLTLQAQGSIHSFGGPPAGASVGRIAPYGFAAATPRGSVYVVVNPGQTVATLTLPPPAPNQPQQGAGRVQFRDAGFLPRLKDNTITLGPGQMAMVGYGAYAALAYSFGVQQDIVIPSSIEPLDAGFHATAPGMIEASIDPPIEGVLRVVAFDRALLAPSSPNGAAGTRAGPNASSGFTLEVTQSGRPIPFRVDGSAQGASGSPDDGPSWLVAEIDVNDLTPGLPVRVRFRSNAQNPPHLEGHAYAIVY